jgi:hypothetical protein
MKTTKLKASLEAKRTSLRVSIPRASVGEIYVDEATGTLKNVAIMTCGEALGHGFSIDIQTLNQVAALINAKPDGVKSRFKHPGESDALGTQIAHVLPNTRVEGNTLRGDIVIGDYATLLPGQGNVRDYLLKLAKCRPGDFGLSAVIGYDLEPQTDQSGNPTALVARVFEVDAVDFVGQGAATPNGLLSAVQEQKPAVQAMAKPKEKIMDPTIKAYLISEYGLKADATDEQAQAFFDALSPDDQAAVKSPEADMAEKPPVTEPAKLATKPTRVSLVTDEGDKLLAQEGKRVAQLSQMGGILKVPGEVVQLAIAAGEDVITAKARYLKHMTDTAKPVANMEGSIRVGDDKKFASLQQAMPDAIMLRAGTRKFYATDDRNRAKRDGDGNPIRREAHELADKFSSLSVLDMYRRWLVAYGADSEEVATLSRSQLCDLLGPRNLRRRFPKVAQLAQSTSDFDNILLDAQNKTMMAGYVEAPRTWNLWAKRATAPDFKNINRINISEVPTPTSRKEGKGIDYVTISDSKETYALTEYASGVILTRLTLINDDVNALQEIPMRQGQACARLEDDVAYAILTANAAMSDTGPLFNAAAATTAGGHGNYIYIASGSGAPSVATVSALEKLIMLQKGPKNAAILNLTPQFWIGPVALKTTAEQFFASRVDPSKSNETPNPYNGKITPISNARLDANSSTAWYLLANHKDGQTETVEVSFLADEPEPVLKQETDFDTDDQRFAVRHVVAAKALEWRGMAKTLGT